MQTEKVIEYLVDWLKNYVENAGMKGYVIGVSGGIDSAVASTLCARTGYPLLTLEMPIHQAKDQVSRANEHILWLQERYSNVGNKEINLTQTFDDFSQAVEANVQEENVELSLANSRSRLRMTTLYYFAGKDRLLVCGTGNKVEDFGVGFFTKYGDGGVDVSPIADLTKSEVYEVAKHLGIVESIQKAKPTDGLWKDNRTDKDQIGATYDELEWAMEQYPEKTDKDFTGRKAEVMRIYERFNRAMQHKVNPIPVAYIPKDLH